MIIDVNFHHVFRAIRRSASERTRAAGGCSERSEGATGLMLLGISMPG
jgi:hypothetical protein